MTHIEFDETLKRKIALHYLGDDNNTQNANFYKLFSRVTDSTTPIDMIYKPNTFTYDQHMINQGFGVQEPLTFKENNFKLTFKLLKEESNPTIKDNTIPSFVFSVPQKNGYFINADINGEPYRLNNMNVNLHNLLAHSVEISITIKKHKGQYPLAFYIRPATAHEDTGEMKLYARWGAVDAEYIDDYSVKLFISANQIEPNFKDMVLLMTVDKPIIKNFQLY